jgi:hypothetical protein
VLQSKGLVVIASDPLCCNNYSPKFGFSFFGLRCLRASYRIFNRINSMLPMALMAASLSFGLALGSVEIFKSVRNPLVGSVILGTVIDRELSEPVAPSFQGVPSSQRMPARPSRQRGRGATTIAHL